jgi:phosphoribosylanthranilate isomerase
MTRTKICGLTSEADVRAAVEAGADAVGVVADVDVDTPREVSVERAAELAAVAPPFVTTVLVTMPPAPDRAVELVRRVGPDAVQVHAGLPPGDLAYLRSKVTARVVQAVDAADPEHARRYDDVADALLVDSTDGDGGGGTGRTHDWERTRELAAELDSPVVLAGGLTPDNVAEAVATVRPFAVDVASGVERAGGRKDHDAVASFVENARRAPARP